MRLSGPDERLGMLVMLGDAVLNCGNGFASAAKHTVAQI